MAINAGNIELSNESTISQQRKGNHKRGLAAVSMI